MIDDNRAIHADFRKILEASSTKTKVLADIEASLFNDVPGVPAGEPFNYAGSVYQYLDK